MIRTLFEIPIPFTGMSIPIYAYGFMLMVGFLVVMYVARNKGKAEGINPEDISNLGLYTIFAVFWEVEHFMLFRISIHINTIFWMRSRFMREDWCFMAA